MTTSRSYKAHLRDSRWQRRRLEIFERDNWTCQACGANKEEGKVEFQIHHHWYEGDYPWEASDLALVTLCSNCHQSEHVRSIDEESLILLLRNKGITSQGVRLLILALSRIPPKKWFPSVSKIFNKIAQKDYSRSKLNKMVTGEWENSFSKSASVLILEQAERNCISQRAKGLVYGRRSRDLRKKARESDSNSYTFQPDDDLPF